jgi:hypothetical protein
MNADDRERFAELLTDVLAFYGQRLSQFGMSVWWQACQPFEFESVQRALSRHAMDPERGQFAPKPADLVRQLVGTPTDRAARAWSVVLDAASRVGAYSDVVFDDAIIHVVVDDLGGWPALCRTESERLSYAQHRFIEAYRAYTNRGDVTAWPRRLGGDRSSDDTYLSRGLPPPKPVLIGDAVRAMQVMRGGSDCGRHQLTKLDDVAAQAIGQIAIERRESAA